MSGRLLLFDRVGQGDAAEHLVELAALAVHAFDLPAMKIHHLHHVLRELRRPRLVGRIDAEGAVEFLHPAELRQALGARAARLQRHGAGELRHGAQFFRGAVRDDPATVDDDRPRAGGVDLLQDVGGEHDRFFAAQLADEVAHLVLLVRVEAVGRLIHDQDIRVVDQRLREAGAVLVALRQRVDGLVEHRVEEAALDYAVQRLSAGAPREAPQLGREIEEALDRHVGIGCGVLGQIANEALRLQRGFGDVEAADGNLALGRRHEAGDHAHGGRLACPVRAEEAEHFAALDGERNAVDCPLRPEGLHEVIDPDHQTWVVSNSSRGRIIAQKRRGAGRRGFKASDFALQFFLLTIPYGPQEKRMTAFRYVRDAALASLIIAASACSMAQTQTQTQSGTSFEPTVGQAGKDVVWVPTPQALVDKMLDMAKVTPNDYVIDLGSGDGRTVITAAKRGARALGIEYNPDMVELSKRNAAKEGMTGKANFQQADLFKSDFSQASVITMFLLPDINIKLRPKILGLKPGTRVVSNSFTMGDWTADETATVGEGCSSWCTAYLWIVPAKVDGPWKLPQGDLTLKQEFQKVSGTLTSGGKSVPLQDGKLRGSELSFRAGGVDYKGTVNGKRIDGTSASGGWSATRGG